MPRHDLHPADQALFELDVAADGRSGRFELRSGFVRHDGALYGGTGLAISVLALEAATGRDVLWTCTQFVSSPQLGDEVTWEAEVLAEGKRTSQLLLRASSGGRTAFVATGSCGVASADGLTGQWRLPPALDTDPEAARPWIVGPSPHPDSWGRHIDLREADLPPEALGGASTALWARRRDGQSFTPATIAFAADFVPLGVARAAGKLGAGSSLDNSMRFRPGESADWVLLQVFGSFSSGGYGHGDVLVWDRAGELLASGSQSAAMKYLFDEGQLSRLPGQLARPAPVAEAPAAD